MVRVPGKELNNFAFGVCHSPEETGYATDVARLVELEDALSREGDFYLNLPSATVT